MKRKNEMRRTLKELKAKFVNIKENEVVLRADDFESGHLTKGGYLSLKLQSDYIPTSEKLVVRIPRTINVQDFREHLEYLATKELIRIKTDVRDALIFSLTFFILGIALLTLPTLIDFFKLPIVNEIVLITSWVFVWASVERRFFEMPKLKDRRTNILHILTSEVTFYKREEDIISEMTNLDL